MTKDGLRGGRHDRRERMASLVHAMTAVGLIAQAIGNVDEPSGRGLLVALPLVGGALAITNVAQQRRGHVASPVAEFAASIVEGLTCAVVGVTSASRGTHYIQYAWFFAAAAVIGAGVWKLRKTRLAHSKVAA